MKNGKVDHLPWCRRHCGVNDFIRWWSSWNAALAYGTKPSKGRQIVGPGGRYVSVPNQLYQKT